MSEWESRGWVDPEIKCAFHWEKKERKLSRCLNTRRKRRREWRLAGRRARPPDSRAQPTPTSVCNQPAICCSISNHLTWEVEWVATSSASAAVEWQADRRTDGRGRSMSMHLFKISLPPARPTARPTNEQPRPTAQGAREAIHNNVDHEMIKRFLVCVRPRPRLCARAKQKLEGKALCAWWKTICSARL